eukprot:scaffold133_cov407-Prasinococcus_capsulatus_cf.AAC.10
MALDAPRSSPPRTLLLTTLTVATPMPRAHAWLQVGRPIDHRIKSQAVLSDEKWTCPSPDVAWMRFATRTVVVSMSPIRGSASGRHSAGPPKRANLRAYISLSSLRSFRSLSSVVASSAAAISPPLAQLRRDSSSRLLPLVSCPLLCGVR